MTRSIDELRRKIQTHIARLDQRQLEKLLDYASLLELQTTSAGPAPAPGPISKPDWPHAPLHRVSDHGTFIVTACTLHKHPLFRGKQSLDVLHDTLLTVAGQHGWTLEAWAVFPNHYHFVAHATKSASKLDLLVAQLHADTARELNHRERQSGRRVWFNYWDTALTFEQSYLARLAYVHQNAVKHGLVRVANQYPWCSAAWFERTAKPAQVKTIYGFRIDSVNVRDDYDVTLVDLG